MVFQRSRLHWRRGESVCHGYMCILLYVKFIFCSGFVKVYARLKEGDGVSLPWLYVNFLYLKPIWCSGFPDIYAQLEECSGVSLPWIKGAFFYI